MASRFASAARRRLRPSFEELEPRLAPVLQPTNIEQLFLEQLNDARADPAAYGAAHGLPELASVPPAPPLAFNLQLVQAAHLHSQDMDDREYADHVNPEGKDPSDRIRDAGFPLAGNAADESITGLLGSPDQALLLLITNAGDETLRDRRHLLGQSDNHLQVGVGIVLGGTGPVFNCHTIDTANSFDTRPFLLGVVSQDLDADGEYDPGEGLAGVTVSVAGVGEAQTYRTGGYGFPLNPGTYAVTVSGGVVAEPVTQTVTIGVDSHRLNFQPAVVPPQGALFFSAAELTVTENAGAATVTIQRGGGSQGAITVDYATSNGTALAGADYDAQSGTLTFGPGETSKTITIPIRDDLIVEGGENFHLALSNATGGAILGSTRTAVVNIADFEPGQLQFSAATYHANENGPAASITVTRSNGTDGSVTVAYATTDGSAAAGVDYLAASGTLTFGPGEADKSFLVTLTSDGVDEDPETVHLALSNPTGGAGLGTTSSAVLTIVDTDPGNLQITPLMGLLTTERGVAGGQASFAVRLTSTPSADVQVPLSSSDTSEGSLSILALTFTPSNALTPQTVIVTGVDDTADDGDIAYAIQTAPLRSTDLSFEGVDPPDVALTNLDNDAAGVTVSPTTGLVTAENGWTATITLVLDSTPTSDVSIGLASSDPTEGTVAPTFVRFTPLDALTPQTITVTGVDDDESDGPAAYTIVTSSTFSDDASYRFGTVPDVSVVNLDDEPGITVSPSSGAATTEAGGTVTFTVSLNSVPTESVTIAVSTTDNTEAVVIPATLVFAPGDALTPQTVTVTGVNDAILDGDVPYLVILAPTVSADPGYAGFDPADVSLTNTDDDVPRGPGTFLDADGDSYTVRLTGPGAVGVVMDDLDGDGRGALGQLLLHGTTSGASRLSVTVKKVAGGDGYVNIGGISGSGLGSITAKKSNLVGAGIDLTGSLGGLSLRDIRNGADVIVHNDGSPILTPAVIRAHVIDDGTTLDLDGAIRSLVAARFGEGTIRARSIGTLQIRGDRTLGIMGDFLADVTLTAANITALASARIAGEVRGSTFQVLAGDVGSFVAGKFVDSQLLVGFVPADPLDPMQGGTFDPGRRINSFKITGLSNSPTPAFVNSTLAAAEVRLVSLQSVQTVNDGKKFGILADNQIGGVTVIDQRFKLDKNQPLPQGMGDFEVNLQ